MQAIRKTSLALVSAMCLIGCAAGDLVVIPPEVEAAKAPDAAQYPNAHGLYLYDVGYVHFDPIDIGNTYFPSYAYTEYAKIKLLTRVSTEGRYFGNITISHVGDLIDIAASVQKPDGTRKELTKTDFMTTIVVKDVIPGATPPIHAFETVIVFPGIEQGDIISYRYTMRGFDTFWQFSKLDAPVLYSKFMLARPIQRTEIQPVIYDAAQLKPEYSEARGMATGMQGYVGVSRQATYDVWEARNVPAVLSEEGMPAPHEVGSGLFVWQGEKRWDWNTLGNTYAKWFAHYDRPPGKAKDLLAQILQGVADDPREKAKAIYKWVKQTIAILPYNRLSWVPREIEIRTLDIDKLLEEKSGPPEKVANLMFLLLQAAGIETTLVLSTGGNRPQVEEGVPELYQFTHPFLALDDGTLLDTTQQQCAFGSLPWGFEGRKSLWIKKGQVSFKNLPISPPTANQREITVSGSIGLEGEAKVDVRYLITGQMAYAYRLWLTTLSPKEKEEAVRALAIRAADKAEVDDFRLAGLDELDKPIDLTISFHVPGYAEMLKDKVVFKAGAFVDHLACPVLASRGSFPESVCPRPTTENRQNPVRFPFRFLDDMSVDVTFPPNFSLQALPKGFRTKEIDKGTAVGLQTSFGSPDGKSLKVIRKYSVNESEVGKTGYSSLRGLISRYLGQKDTLLTLELPKMD